MRTYRGTETTIALRADRATSAAVAQAPDALELGNRRPVVAMRCVKRLQELSMN